MRKVTTARGRGEAFFQCLISTFWGLATWRKLWSFFWVMEWSCLAKAELQEPNPSNEAPGKVLQPKVLFSCGSL